MATRIIAGTVLLGLCLAAVAVHGIALYALIVIIALVSQFEVMQTIKNSGVKLTEPVLYGCALLMGPAYMYGGLLWAVGLLTLSVMMIFFFGVTSKKCDYESIFASMIPLCYPQLFFLFFHMTVFGPAVRMSQLMLIIALTSSVLTDTFALFTGKLLGKHKLCPTVSPHKTVEGAVGGLIGGTVGVTILLELVSKSLLHIWIAIALGALLSILAQIGDLAASVMKRRYGVKDFGNLIPGHGGIMDRLDSIMFTVVGTYLFFTMAGLV